MKIQVTVQGIAPLLMNRFTEKSEISGSAGHTPVHAGEKGTPREQATPKCYADRETGELFIPGPNIFSALIAAGTFHKSGKAKLTTMRSSLIPAGCWVLDVICPLGTKDFEVDSRSVVIPSTGGRIMCHRPRLDEWRLTFNLEIDQTMFSEKLIRTLVDDAGRRIGLGDWRPQRKGPFGRFVVIEWAVIQDEIRAAA